jgi:iron-sulfur cluster repair protein YtfE (RIC family)
MAAITSDMKVGEIVRNWPATMRVFRSHNLNLQCGGTHSVAYAADKHGFELETFLAELNAAVGDAAAPSPQEHTV